MSEDGLWSKSNEGCCDPNDRWASNSNYYNLSTLKFTLLETQPEARIRVHWHCAYSPPSRGLLPTPACQDPVRGTHWQAQPEAGTSHRFHWHYNFNFKFTSGFNLKFKFNFKFKLNSGLPVKLKLRLRVGLRLLRCQLE